MTDVETEDSFLLNVYQRFPLTIEKGDGVTIWDADGKKYIDCMGGYGVGLIGYSDKRVIAGIEEQLKKIMVCHMSVYNNSRLRFLRKLTDIAPVGVTKIFFSNSGAESVEAALKFARKYSQKPGIISMYGGYHGKTFGALSVTHNAKYRKSFVPLLNDIKFIPYGNVDSLIDSIDDKTGTVILEPIQGETGVILPPDGFIKSVRKACDERNVVLIFDEIQTGLGRTGKMWAGEHWEAVPDVMCVAKGIAAGIPMGVTFMKPKIAEVMKVGDHSSTFAGNPIACAAGNAVLDVISEDNLVKRAAETGSHFKSGLLELKERHQIIREVRGLGMMLAVEMRFDVRDILLDGIKNGLLMLYSGRNIIRLLPPLIMEKEMVDQALSIMDSLLSAEAKRHSI
ncbi:MAG: aminotransferase class III-fold pyridoxal phosphate-dependent enzyme [Thermoproteota archaeon]|nr:aminotransferase class III-fold pyridoxal phosphate-dependent enzyme [Thermoproteota archaeon]